MASRTLSAGTNLPEPPGSPARSATTVYRDVPMIPVQDVREAPVDERDDWARWNDTRGDPRYALQPRAPQNDNRMWCLMLTLIILCGAGVLVAVLVSAMVFMSAQRK